MPYGKWNILEDETVNEYGYSTQDLTNGSHKPIKIECIECGIKTIKPFREVKRFHRCKIIIDGKKKCFKCKKWLELESFSKNRHVFGGYQKVCKNCFADYECVKKGYKEKSKKLKNNIEEYFKGRSSNIKSRIRNKNLEFDLDGEFLYNLYLQQNKKCFYSEIEILHNVGCYQYNSISVERLDPDLGYTKDNVVLCAYSINSFKGCMSEKQFKDFLKEVVPSLKRYSES